MIIDEYIEYQNKYVSQFCNKILVLMEVGSFFEYYYINNENTGEIWNYELIQEVNQVLDNICCLKKTKKEYYMGGFPKHSLRKHLTKLLNAGFTIITIEQNKHTIQFLNNQN